MAFASEGIWNMEPYVTKGWTLFVRQWMSNNSDVWELGTYPIHKQSGLKDTYIPQGTVNRAKGLLYERGCDT